ncbi:MAG TPA: M20/M25/M40 family metallo-hydrolase, partial [Candidatus Kapabacteria bacterium]|nr:M20/M25/M40 family metallo-hydrolase [Candidatus Kapabacteria bacterium]
MELGGAIARHSEGYPSWTPNIKSNILKIAKDVYKNMYGNDPKVEVIHAGLECGIIGDKYQGMEMLSIGPNLFDVHTPDERVQISSVKNVWNYLIELLKNIPEKGK